jgi:hypothetical protein
LGTSGNTIGHAHLTWAFSEAAALFLRHNEAGQTYLARLTKKPDKGKALTILAHQLARAVYYRLTRKTAFDMDRFLRTSGSRAGEPGVSLDTQREAPASRGLAVLFDGVWERSGAPRPGIPEPCALLGPPLWLFHKRRPVAQGCVCCPSPAPGTHWQARFASPFL